MLEFILYRIISSQYKYKVVTQTGADSTVTVDTVDTETGARCEVCILLVLIGGVILLPGVWSRPEVGRRD